MKYKYVGPKRGDKCLAYGEDFTSGAVDVKRPHALAKLAANPEFEEVKAAAKPKAKPKAKKTAAKKTAKVTPIKEAAE